MTTQAAPAPTPEPTMMNGVNVTDLVNTVQAVGDDPALGKFQFRAAKTWLDGGHNRSTIQQFYGCRAEDTTRTAPFVMDADEPPVLLGRDAGANPVEYILHALAACMTTSMVYHAAARGIEIEAVDSSMAGELDLQDFLGLRDDVRKGYRKICVDMRVKTGAAASELRELLKFSPVYEMMSSAVPMEVSVETY